MRGRFRQRYAAVRADQVFGKILHFPVFGVHDGEFAFPLCEGGHYRVPYAFFIFVFRLQLVDDQFDEVRFVPVQRAHFFEKPDFPVYAHLVESFLLQ